ncbi:NAD dependent epimerase/dehydratase family protein, partial [Vibrio parahaemolyticus VPTS-2010_2]
GMPRYWSKTDSCFDRLCVRWYQDHTLSS